MKKLDTKTPAGIVDYINEVLQAQIDDLTSRIEKLESGKMKPAKKEQPEKPASEG